MRFLFIFLIATVSHCHAQSFVPETTVKKGQARPERKSLPAENLTTTANPWEKMEAWSFQFGSHTEFFNNVQSDASGSQRKFDFAPTIGLGMKFSFSPSWKFLPEVNWVLPLDAGSSNMISNLFMIRGDVGYELFDWLRLRAGTSLMFLNMHGKGGKTQVSNGTGKSTFYNPDENRTALNNTFDLGAEAFFTKDWSARVQTYTYSLFQEERRQLSYTLFLSHYWE